MGVQTKRWTRAEYDRLVRHGVLGEDDPVQLIHGEIVEMAPQGAAHATAVGLVADILQSAFRIGYHVRVGLPLALSDDSEPEPDVAVVLGGRRDYADHHPAGAVLVVEVSGTTGEFDRSRKASMYAEAGVPEYWVLDIQGRFVDVYRDPAAGHEGGAGYTSHHRVAEDGVVTPMTLASARTLVRDLLPCKSRQTGSASVSPLRGYQS